MTDELEAVHYHELSAYRGRQDDGRHLYIFSQSLLKQVEICPERGRRALFNLHPRSATDGTAIGTAVHLAIELCIQSMIDGQGWMEWDDMVSIATDEFDLIMADPTSRWVNIKTAETAHSYITNCIQSFCFHVRWQLSPLAVEQHWGPYTIHEDEQRVIQLEGTIDYIDAVCGLTDWKTAGRAWQAWEHERWDVQATVYTWAYVQTQVQQVRAELPQASVWEGWGGSPSSFTWHVFQTNGDYQKVETTRFWPDWNWLKERVVGLAKLIEADLDEWFKNDTTALCSVKWCDGWAECKGKHQREST